MSIIKTVGYQNRDARATTVGEEFPAPAGDFSPPSVPWVWEDGRLSYPLPFYFGGEQRWIVPLDSTTLGMEDAVGGIANGVIIDTDPGPGETLVSGWTFHKYEEGPFIYPYQAAGE